MNGQMRWFGKSWGAPMNADCERVAVPVGQACAYCTEAIGPDDQGVQTWHIGTSEQGYRPLHYACFMRQTTGGLGHVLLHGTGGCHGECLPDPDWLPKRRAAELAEELWQRARLAGA